jgi:hypothetical protein
MDAADPGLAATAAVRGAGRNSRIYRVRRGAECFAVKHYPSSREDPCDRLKTEVEALELMGRNGIAVFSRPMGSDDERGYARLNWILQPRPAPRRNHAEHRRCQRRRRSLEDVARPARQRVTSECCRARHVSIRRRRRRPRRALSPRQERRNRNRRAYCRSQSQFASSPFRCRARCFLLLMSEQSAKR